MYVDVEVRTPKVRVDVVMRTTHTLYVIELKLDKSADSALAQINLKNYPERFVLCGLPVVKAYGYPNDKTGFECRIGWATRTDGICRRCDFDVLFDG